MITAARRTLALKTSCPTPLTAEAMTPADAATTNAPRTPAPTPEPIHRVLPGTPRAAAYTTLTISAASRTSRKTRRAVASMNLLRDQHALGGLFVEFAVEGVAARLQRADEYHHTSLGGDDLFAVELIAFEL